MNGPAHRSDPLLATVTLWRREMVRFLRERGRVVGALGTPVVFWLLIGSGFDRVFRLGDDADPTGYLAYFFPGIVVMILLFTAIFSTFSVIEDRQAGFMQGVLVATVSRWCIVFGKVLGGTTLAVGQALLFLALWPLMGAPLGVASILGAVGVMLVTAVALTGLGFVLAWRMSSTQGFHSIMNLLLMPMWLLSGAVFPVETAPTWLRYVMTVNPLTYAVAALRHVLDAPGTGFVSLPTALGVTVLFALATTVLSVRVVCTDRTGGSV